MNIADIRSILDQLEYHDWKFVTGFTDGAMYVQARFMEPCSETGVMMEQSSRKWLVSKHATKTEIVLTCLKMILTAIEHEARENFKYNGLAIFGPHPDIDALWETISTMIPDAREVA